MTLKLIRTFKGPEYTIGKLYIDDKYFCDCLEDVNRDLYSTMSEEEILSKKVYGETAIPYGTYKVAMNTVSPKFANRSWAKPYQGCIPRILDVKGFQGVLIHPGNKKEDTLGCLLVGFNKVKGKVVNSVKTFKELMSILLQDKDNIDLTIE